MGKTTAENMLIQLTFPLLQVLTVIPIASLARPALETSTFSTTYCPWPPCYYDSWDLDYAQIPIITEDVAEETSITYQEDEIIIAQ